MNISDQHDFFVETLTLLFFISSKAMVTFDWFKAISLEAKKNPKTKMSSVSEDDFQPRGHKPVPKTPKEPIRNQHIKNAHLNNLDVK